MLATFLINKKPYIAYILKKLLDCIGRCILVSTILQYVFEINKFQMRTFEKVALGYPAAIVAMSIWYAFGKIIR